MLTAPWELLVVDGWRKDEGSGTLSCVFTVLASLTTICVYVFVCVQQGQ